MRLEYVGVKSLVKIPASCAVGPGAKTSRAPNRLAYMFFFVDSLIPCVLLEI